MPEIGISGLPLENPHSGTASYVRQLVPLLPEVAPDLSFRLYVRWSDESFAGVEQDRLVSPAAPLNRGRGVGAQMDKLLWEIGSWPLASAIRRDALLHSPTFAAPVQSHAPFVVTIHDLIPLTVPGYHRSRQSAVYSRFMAVTVKGAAAIITVSEHSRREIVSRLGIDAERIHVTYEAAGPQFGTVGSTGEGERVSDTYGLPPRFALYLGGSERRKNIATLVRAWGERRTDLRREGLKLVIVATFPPPDPLYPDVPSLVSELGLQDDVVLVPRVTEQDKPALYRAAEMFCFPSHHEGFGLPPLEAMASGIPVICSDATSLPEVVGNAARMVSPNSVTAWGEALVEIACHPVERERLVCRGLQRAALFSWGHTAERTVDVYRKVLAR